MSLRLSARTRWDLQPSPLHEALQQRGRRPLLDLTVSNPTAVGLDYDDATYARLGDAGNRGYAPHPLGLASAREAVADYYAPRGIAVDPARVLLTAGTSEAYAHLFAVLTDPGDAVLVPRPGYPLLDHLADLAGVRQVPYRLAYDDRWFVDAASLPDVDARAIVVVAPGNPTGHVPDEGEAALLAACAPVTIIDEVFADYPLELDDAELARRRAPCRPAFLLGGLSKAAALPQLKLSWIVALGDGLDDAMARAEVIADAFLSVATPVQRALPALLAAAGPMQRRIRARLSHNLATIDRVVAGTPVDRLRVDAGFTALLRLPALFDDQAWALHLLERADILVQPGYLFDIPSPPRVAVSLLTRQADLERGIVRLVETVVRGPAVLP
jgi:aspartate/methionine/tyrosine aminotransferase